jgi:hypothetical protein
MESLPSAIVDFIHQRCFRVVDLLFYGGSGEEQNHPPDPTFKGTK